MQDAVEHGRGEHRVAGEGFVPAAERQVGRQHHRRFRKGAEIPVDINVALRIVRLHSL